jgi:hypothetical protein
VLEQAALLTEVTGCRVLDLVGEPSRRCEPDFRSLPPTLRTAPDPAGGRMCVYAVVAARARYGTIDLHLE